MKRTNRMTWLALAAIGIALALSCAAQEFQPLAPPRAGPEITLSYPPIVLDTNVSPPLLAGPFIDFLGNLATATNWGVATFGIVSGDQAGAGVVALYNISPYVGTGVGIDWLGEDVTMPSAQVQIQAPFRIGGTNGIIVRPFAFTGVATPISGKGEENGTVVGLVGAGIGVKVWKGFNLFYGIEQRTGEAKAWQLFGVAWSASF